jgi:serine/threonine protein kinase
MTAPTALTASDVERLLNHRFSLDRELGRGGQGVVFLATRQTDASGAKTHDRVALKVHLDPLEDERVAREIGVMEQLQHSNLARLIEHGTLVLGQHVVRFIAWEYIEGEPLSHRLAAGPIDPRTVAVIGRDVGAALAQFLPFRVVHRDVNAKNIMLREGDANAVLIDLGCARHLTQQSLTATGYTWGTPGYMSPEQAVGGQQLTCFSDVYSLGLTMLEALTGRHPTARRQDLLTTVPISARALASHAPEPLTALIDRMMSLRIAGRLAPDQVAERATQILAAW